MTTRPVFTTLTPLAKQILSEETGTDFTDVDMSNWFCATAHDNEGNIKGILACEPKTPFDYHFSIAILDPSCLHPRSFKAVFTALFSVARRVTALIDPKNTRAIAGAQRMGFVYEGFLRRGLDGTRDALIYGMLPEDCIWLIPHKYHKAVRQNGVQNGIRT